MSSVFLTEEKEEKEEEDIAAKKSTEATATLDTCDAIHINAQWRDFFFLPQAVLGISASVQPVILSSFIC